jgi:hypothetical protein
MEMVLFSIIPETPDFFSNIGTIISRTIFTLISIRIL